VGDRLRLGMIEFEVLPHAEIRPNELKPSAVPSAAPKSRSDQGTGDFVARIDRLEQQLATCTQRDVDAHAPVRPPSAVGFQQAIDKLTQQVAEERQRRLADQQLWETERQRLNAELSKSAEQLSELAAELAKQQQHREATEEQCHQIRVQLADLEEARSRSAEEREAAILEHRRVLEDSLRVQQQLEAELAESREQLLSLKDDVDRHRQLQTEWETAREELEAGRRHLQEALEKHAGQIDQLQREQEEERQRWMQERAALESAVTAKESQLVKHQDESVESREAFDRKRQELESLLEKEQHAREELEQHAQQQRSKCEALEWRVDEYEQIVSELRGQCEELRAAAAEASEDVADSSRVAMEQECKETADEAQGTEELRQPLETLYASEDVAQTDEDLTHDELPNQNPAGSPQTVQTAPPWQYAATDPGDANRTEDGQPLKTESPPSEIFPESAPSKTAEQIDSSELEDAVEVGNEGTRSGASTAEVLARLRHAEFGSDEQPGSVDDLPRPCQDPAGQMLESSLSAVMPTTSLAGEQGGEVAQDDEEETIEAYMSRLLQRVGGAGPEGAPLDFGSQAKILAPAPALASEAQTTAADTEMVVTPSDAEFTPRRPAPELSSNLAAMRALANDTTRTAIASHEDRSATVRVKTRILVCFLALMMIAALMLVFASHPAVFGVGIVSGTLVLAYVTRLAWSVRNRPSASTDHRVPSQPVVELVPEPDTLEPDQLEVTPGS
jgi:hypothetical protein